LTEKAPLLFPLVQRAILKERLDVLPTERLLSEKPPFSLALEVMPKARYKKIFLVTELRIQPRLVHTCGPLQVLEACVGEPMLPEDRHRFLQYFLSAKVLRAPHATYCPIKNYIVQYLCILVALPSSYRT
jgi:hypothetical protein